MYNFYGYHCVVFYVCCSLRFWLKFQLGNFLLPRLARLPLFFPHKPEKRTPSLPELFAPRLEISNCLGAVWLASCLDLGILGKRLDPLG